MIRNFFTVGGWTMASRILGFVRDIMIAAFLGAGPVAEAFLVAFSLPNMFRRFFAEGAFNMAFVPLFSKKLEKGENALGFARDALTALGGLLIFFTLIAQLAMPFLVLAMAAGFAADERLPLAVLYGRIAFPYILFISLAALASGVLNAAGRFAAAAAAPVLLNIVFITALLLADRAGFDMGLTLAWAVPIAGVLQFALVWEAARRAGFPLLPRRPRLTADLRRLAVIAAPAALAGGVVQINLLVGRQVASFFDGAIAWLNYADRLYQLPLGVVGIAVGVVLLPELSRRLAAGDEAAQQASFSRAAEFALLLTLPAAAALVAIPDVLVRGLFERGAFTATDTAPTAAALAVYAAGLPAFVLQKVFQPLFFARENTATPFRYALVALVVNAALAIGLAPLIGWLAAAIGTTGAGWAMAWLLWRGSRPMGRPARADARLVQRLPRIALAALLLGLGLRGGVVLFARSGLDPASPLGLVLVVCTGGLLYLLLLGLTGAARPAEIRAMLGRSRR